MKSVEFTLDFQVGTSFEAHKIMGFLSGKTENEKVSNNFKAPFSTMADAYLFALILGLSMGEKEKVTRRVTYANFNQSVAKNIDISTLLLHLGERGDVKDQDSARKAIEEYATWGLIRLGKAKIGLDDYRISKLLKSIIK
ncbi:MAG: hypothetical protein P8Q35_01050 [Candidatus Thalassarchaeaceae archaeon]|nr:hypothetical protein [Candidatus Thalassarchaeaceae archaeon]